SSLSIFLRSSVISFLPRRISDLIKVIRDLEKALETFNADEDLDVTRSIKSDIRRGKKEITELRKNIDKLERELKDTNRKYQYLAQ
ncbi:MAG: hypothetical protein AAFV93_14990, partial [Chloroflexota bacterium]